MKKVWEAPKIEIQRFQANEYVSACIQGRLQCMYPGNGQTNGQEIYDDYNNDQSGWYKDSHNMLHGICGNDAAVSFNGDTAKGYESVDGVAQTNRVIFDIEGYKQEVGTYYNVTWKSQVDNSDIYHHIGRLIITLVDPTRANHS